MQIDWITVVAQIANFLVLVWLLQRFLYQPVTRAMAEREDEVTSRLAEARSARQAAQDEASTLRDKQADLESEKQEILEAARREAQDMRDRQEKLLRQEMDAKRSSWQRHLEEERGSFSDKVQARAGQELIKLTQQMLTAYAHADLANETVHGFVARLRALEEDQRERLAAAAAHGDDPVIVHSSTALTPGQRGHVTRAIHDILKPDIEVEYRQDRDLVLGIRLTVAEQTIEWSAARHLARLHDALNEVIDSAASRRATTADAPGG